MLFKNDEKARAQHNAVRENAGWYRWTHDLIEVRGADSGNVLDCLFVNSTAKAAVGRSKYTTMLNNEGGIIDDVIVTHMGDDYWWVSTLYGPKLIPIIEAAKGKRDVTCRDITYEIDMYAIQGPKSTQVMNKLLAVPVDDMKRFEMSDNKIGNISVRIHRSGFTGELGYEVYCDIADTKAVEAAIRKAADASDAPEITILEVYVRSLPVEKGFALRQDMYGLTPYEAGLEWSVDLTKDFVGKDALIETKEAGPKKKLVGLEYLAESYEDINQGERIRCRGRDIGLVRAAIYGYTVGKNIGFAVVDAKYAESGTHVTIGSNDSPAVIVPKQWI